LSTDKKPGRKFWLFLFLETSQARLCEGIEIKKAQHPLAFFKMS